MFFRHFFFVFLRIYFKYLITNYTNVLQCMLTKWNQIKCCCIYGYILVDERVRGRGLGCPYCQSPFCSLSLSFSLLHTLVCVNWLKGFGFLNFHPILDSFTSQILTENWLLVLINPVVLCISQWRLFFYSVSFSFLPSCFWDSSPNYKFLPS